MSDILDTLTGFDGLDLTQQGGVPLGTVDGVPSQNTASPFYLPPPGYIQADNGQIVPQGTLNQSSLPPLPGMTGAISSANSGGVIGTAQKAFNSVKGFLTPSNVSKTLFGIDLEDGVFIVLGLLLIAAGIFAFDKTRDIVVGGARAATEALA